MPIATATTGQRHWVAMAGLHGCLPQFCSCYSTYDGAVEALAQVHELGQRRMQLLKRQQYLELNLQRDGNAYAEIVACDCVYPSQHDG